MSRINKFNLEIYSKSMQLLAYFEVLEENYVLELKEKSYYSVKCKEPFVLNDVYYAFIGELFGRIVSVTDSKGVYEYKIAIGADAFDYEYVDDTNFSNDIENIIQTLLRSYNSLFNNNLLSLTINRKSTTEGYYTHKKIKNFSDFYKEINRLYGISLDLKADKTNKIMIDISKKQNGIFDLSFNDERVIDYEVNFSQDNPTMVIVHTTYNSYGFYLCDDGSVDSGTYPDNKKTRLPVIKNKIIDSDENLNHDEAKLLAEDILLASENNEILVDYNIHGIDSFQLLGLFVNFYLPNGVLIKTSITKIESTDDEQLVKLTLGATRKSLIDKLKHLNNKLK